MWWFLEVDEALNAEVSILKKNDASEKKKMLKLIEESEESEDISRKDGKKYFLKYGVKL